MSLASHQLEGGSDKIPEPVETAIQKMLRQRAGNRYSSRRTAADLAVRRSWARLHQQSGDCARVEQVLRIREVNSKLQCLKSLRVSSMAGHGGYVLIWNTSDQAGWLFPA